ncbi:hypothetical protein LSTR_LSTR004109 [Laodelphax striatellus]|uniref:CHK kinase-like domain-containing protein n=1 Tax=Laodelphax striatellus TaxID=195883 RepID=A0A482WHM1_LAOST|nr:hypothetical protein LSTR_LSTR004109 [Laodelphax striatellus]
MKSKKWTLSSSGKHQVYERIVLWIRLFLSFLKYLLCCIMKRLRLIVQRRRKDSEGSSSDRDDENDQCKLMSLGNGGLASRPTDVGNNNTNQSSSGSMIETPLVSALERDAEFLARLLRAAEGDPHLRVDRLHATPAARAGPNYMASITRMHLFGRRGSQEHSFRRVLLVKRQSSGVGAVTTRRSKRSDPAFCNEAAAYDVVLPALRPPPSQPPLPFAQCLYASSHLLILHDLCQDGYVMADRRQGVDFHHCRLVLQTLAKFHAASLVMKHNDKTGFERMRTHIQELIFVPEAVPVFGASLENSLKMAISTLKSWCGPEDVALDDAIHKLQMLQGQVFQRMVQVITPKEPLAVICHGDFWINNMLFRYNEEDKTAEDVKFVDLQVTRYASPVTDILLFLYTSAERDVTRMHYDDLLDIYHHQLISSVSQLAPSAPAIKLTDLVNEIERHALFALLMVLLLLPAVTADSVPDDVIHNNNYETADQQSSLELQKKGCLESTKECLTPRYREHVRDMVLEFVDRGFI